MNSASASPNLGSTYEPDGVQALTPRASTALADTLLTTRAAQENKELRQKLTALRWLPDVQSELHASCNVPDAAERGLALSRLLQAAVNSRHGMTEVWSALPPLQAVMMPHEDAFLVYNCMSKPA